MANLSFEDGWDDILIGGTATQPGREAQQPKGWTLTALPLGADLLSKGAFPNDDPPVKETVGTLPECVHKRIDMLPEKEGPLLPDGTPNPNAIILPDGGQ